MAIGIAENPQHSYLICKLCGKWVQAGSTPRWLFRACSKSSTSKEVAAFIKPAALKRANAGLHPSVAVRTKIAALFGLAALPVVKAGHAFPTEFNPVNPINTGSFIVTIIIGLFALFGFKSLYRFFRLTVPVRGLAFQQPWTALGSAAAMPARGTPASHLRNRQRQYNKEVYGKYSDK